MTSSVHPFWLVMLHHEFCAIPGNVHAQDQHNVTVSVSRLAATIVDATITLYNSVQLHHRVQGQLLPTLHPVVQCFHVSSFGRKAGWFSGWLELRTHGTCTYTSQIPRIMAFDPEADGYNCRVLSWVS